MVAATTGVSGFAAEYELEGELNQRMDEFSATNLHTSASFTVFVRDCGWLIETTETNELGAVYKRAIGSTNGSEIYECEILLQAAHAKERLSRVLATGKVISNNIPVGQLDNAVVGHLWLMFASQCYWPKLTTHRLTPVYDWQASVAAHGENKTVEAEWELLAGPGSLPREVRYLGKWGETNGLYKVTGTNSAGGTMIPSGFVFEERHVGPLKENSFVHEMTLRKRVDVEVTAVRPVCSRKSLIPTLDGPTLVADLRLEGSRPSSDLPLYINPTPGQWPMIAKARKLAEDFQAQRSRGAKPLAQPHHTAVLVALMCALMLGPLGMYLLWRKSAKLPGKS
jgi:hypothetical protein